MKSQIDDQLNYSLGKNIHAFSVARGQCCPSQPYSGFNVCDYTGDEDAHVAFCLDVLSDITRVNRIFLPRQTHSCNVAIVDQFSDRDLNDVDALVTDKQNVMLGVNTADCVPILFADSDAGVIAVAHSGWRGTVGHIALATVQAMISLGADPKHIKVAMGPSICVDCFEVGNDVAEKFVGEWNCNVDQIIVYKDKPHIDLRQAIALDLIATGVKPENIDVVSASCSRCCHERWFSARRLGIKSGRTLSAIYR